jgi:Recombination endonuclease VII
MKAREAGRKSHARHKKRVNTERRSKYAANIEEARAYGRARHERRKAEPEYRRRHRELSRISRRKCRGYPEPTRPEPAVCELCGRSPGKKGIALDHNHATGKFRGWLCAPCNLGLGMFADNPVWLERAAAYVRRDGEEEWLCVS